MYLDLNARSGRRQRQNFKWKIQTNKNLVDHKTNKNRDRNLVDHKT